MRKISIGSGSNSSYPLHKRIFSVFLEFLLFESCFEIQCIKIVHFRLLELKELKELHKLGQPRVRRTRSASTRTQSIRRTSLRDKMNTTKRDVQDEKLYFIQSIDGQKVNQYYLPCNFIPLLEFQA